MSFEGAFKTIEGPNGQIMVLMTRQTLEEVATIVTDFCSAEEVTMLLGLLKTNTSLRPSHDGDSRNDQFAIEMQAIEKINAVLQTVNATQKRALN
jgi:hypothetical protein